MTEIEVAIESIWPERAPIVGMVHLMPLPGSPRWGASMGAVFSRATADAEALTKAGFDGILVENYADVPFLKGPVPAETVAAMTAAVLAVRDATGLPVGVNVLRNDAHAAVAIATATGARFIRVNVHAGSMWTDQGLVEGRAADTLRLRSKLGGRVAILADVHVKHATPPSGSDIGTAASDSWRRGLADALVVSGSGTGVPTETRDLEAVRAAVPEACILVGSGVTPENASNVLALADGAIVGSSVMRRGIAGAGVDADRARLLIDAARNCLGSELKRGDP